MKRNHPALAGGFLMVLLCGSAMAESTVDLEPVTLDLIANEAVPSPELDTMPVQADPAPDAPAVPALTVSTLKVGIPLSRVGNAMTVITRQQLDRMQAISLLDVLRQVPGVDVIRNGGPGNTASVFIRGTNAEHTLVLLDGIELNDPISPGRTFNFPDQINLDAVERIEILRGPQGPLYGSDAMGGVINIITRSAEGRPSLYAKVQAGSYGTVEESAGFSGGHGPLRYSLHARRHDSAGFSAARREDGNDERDGFEGTFLTGRVSFEPASQKQAFELFSHYADSKTELDNFGGLDGDDPNYRFWNRTTVLGGRSRIRLFRDRLEQTAKVSWAGHDRKTLNNPDLNHPFDSVRDAYKSQRLAADIQNNLTLHRTNTLTFGMELEHEKGRSSYESQSMFGPFASRFSERSATTVGLYMQDLIRLGERFFATVGARLDEHNRFGRYLTYRGAGNFLIHETGTTLKSSYGTGFKAPTLFQLYSSFGDPHLQPETSFGWDAGVEQSLLKNNLRIGMNFFRNRIEDMIQFNPGTFRYENIGQARTLGTEAYLSAGPWRGLTLNSSYTWTRTRDLDTGEALLRRPRHKWQAGVNYQPHPKLNFNLDVLRVGRREDLDFAMFPATRVTLKPYTLVNLTGTWDVHRRMQIFAQLANVLNASYEEVKGFGVPRFSAYGGVRMRL